LARKRSKSNAAAGRAVGWMSADTGFPVACLNQRAKCSDSTNRPRQWRRLSCHTGFAKIVCGDSS
jgi:hypothetical protein